jgi:uncharacterized protein
MHLVPAFSRRGPSLVRLALFLLTLLALPMTAATPPAAGPVLKVLFLGDNGHHKPAERLRELAPVMMNRGIHLVYTEDVAAALTLTTLQRYDALLIYANLTTLAPAQEQALVDYVTQGGGLVALHTASASFRTSARYAALVGARFATHKTGTFRVTPAAPDHPVMQGFPGFESWDETYVHTLHNEQGRTVLETREGEPWTWIRTEGRGRVFYTAWGHDERTWTNPGYHDLVERGIRHAAGQTLPAALATRPAVPALTLVDQAGIPYYPPGQRTQGDSPWPQIQKPLAPADSHQRLIVPAGFAVELVASEPDIKKPIAMQWDERGRLWLAESLDYPNRLLKADEPGRDRLLICEDTNADGRMDKFTVFADGLNIPTGFIFARGGVIVHQAPATLFLQDTDGDDRADVREVLFRGWGRSDTHAGPNNLQYGFDNWIHGMVGYASFDGTVGGEPSKFRQGFYRFRPDGSQLEFLRGTNNNTWGLGFSEEGLLFASTANNNPSVHLPIPDRYYLRAGLEPKILPPIADSARYLPVTTRVRQVDVHWGYTSAAGHALYTARQFPREYWNRIAFVTDPTGHLVGQFNLEPRGAGFASKNPTNLIASDDEWFAPIMAEVGPDGAVWVIDWYNYIVQHNPTPRGFQKGEGNAYENELRDQRHGRIYRIVWRGDGAQPAPAFTLANATPTQLVAALGHDNLFWRRHAQRLLVERGRRDVVPALLALVRNPATDAIGLNVGAIHALWTLDGLRAIDAEPAALTAATEALRHPSAGVRRTALQVLPHSAATAAAVLAAKVLNDPDAQVRLAALLALAETPAVPAAGPALLALLAPPDLKLDRWTLDAAKMAATTQREAFLKAVPAEQLARARTSLGTKTQNTLPVDNFESCDPAALPADWIASKSAGEPTAALDASGYNGSARSLRISHSTTAAETSVAKKITVKPGTRYELTAWVKTAGVATTGRALGALVRIPEIQQPTPATSVALTGNVEWTALRFTFQTAAQNQITVACVLGHTGPARGTAWFDDLVLTDLGPADNTIAEPLTAVLAHLLAQNKARATATEPAATGPAPVVLTLGVLPDVMKYDRAELTVKAGVSAKLVFKNADHMPHNALILRPGTTEAVGTLADTMLADPQALAKNYTPASADVLFTVPLVNPGETAELVFTAPAQPGRYPILCTFPGHWRLMQATLVVTP